MTEFSNAQDKSLIHTTKIRSQHDDDTLPPTTTTSMSITLSHNDLYFTDLRHHDGNNIRHDQDCPTQQ